MLIVYHQAAIVMPSIDADGGEAFKDLLLRMSLSDDSLSSKAVLYCLFSIATIHKHKNMSEATHFKDLAMQALRDTATCPDGLDLADRRAILQHVVANLLLCRAEVRARCPVFTMQPMPRFPSQ